VRPAMMEYTHNMYTRRAVIRTDQINIARRIFDPTDDEQLSFRPLLVFYAQIVIYALGMTPTRFRKLNRTAHTL